MTASTEVQNEQPVQPAANDKEYNFAQIRKALEQERIEKAELKKQVEETKSLLQQLQSRQESESDDEGGDELYIDHKKLEKKLNKYDQKSKQETATTIQREVSKALEEERRRNWLKQNPDFEEVMTHAQKLADMDPEYAETVLNMPESFERQKLVYKNVKMLNLHKPPEAKSNVQEKIDQNKRGHYYQPTGIGTPPYGIYSTSGKNVSPSEGKAAYEKLLQLKANLRLG